MKLFTALLVATSLLVSVATAKELKYPSRIDVEQKFGSERNLTQVEFFTPILQGDKSLLFLDVRGWQDDNDTSETNIGIGFRKIFNDNFIFGIYGFADKRKTNFNNSFDQRTYGAEILTENYDFRLNYYDSDEEKLSTPTQAINSSPTISGSQILVNQQSYETAFSGYDIEVGRTLPSFEDVTLFATYYSFSNNTVNKDLDGYRVRSQYNFYNSGDKKHRLYFDAEHSNDDLRDDINFFGLRYSYKIGNTKNLTKLEERMTNRVIRDIDIVAGEFKPTTKESLKGTDGNDIGIKFVDLGANEGGDGTEASPYDSLDNTDNKFLVNDVIYVTAHGNVDARDATNITLRDGQKLVSVGHSISLSDLTNNYKVDVVLKQAQTDAARPKIKTILAANNNLIQGFDVSNDDDEINNGGGIRVFEKTGNIIKDNISSNNERSGIYVRTIDQQSNEIIGNIINNNAVRGIYIRSDSNSKNYVTDNEVNENDFSGIYILSLNDAENYVTGNEVNENDGDGIYINSLNDAENYVTGNRLTDNDISDVGSYAINVNDDNNSYYKITDNTLTRTNGGVGLGATRINIIGGSTNGNSIVDNNTVIDYTAP